MMNKLVKIILIALILACGALLKSQAAFKDGGWGARPLGMGGAFTSVSDDANAPLFNPAAMAGISRIETSFMSARLFMGLEEVEIGQNCFSCVCPVNTGSGSLGVSWSSLYSPALYREDSFNLSYGRSVDDIIETGIFNISCGASLKYLSHKYTLDKRTVDDPVFESGSSKGGISIDLSFLARWPAQNISAAFASRNINEPDLGLKTADKVSNENVLGVSYTNGNRAKNKNEYYVVSADFVERDGIYDMRAGLEKRFFNGHMSARAGAQSYAYTAGLGCEFAIAHKTDLCVDYAFTWPVEIQETSGSHRMGITVKF